MTSPGSKAYRSPPAAMFEMVVAESIAQLAPYVESTRTPCLFFVRFFWYS